MNIVIYFSCLVEVSLESIIKLFSLIHCKRGFRMEILLKHIGKFMYRSKLIINLTFY